ncbi:Transcriptional regulator [Candidatus Syntrophocurvum alkaliphilum]|uniref:HTH-type transcriptional regulatory protein TyrR n=1 Tax=Candidatus Syntrophocurvum alkaliphilum TaxID=2293317 RepID=A0A6I6DBV5_9FIRM|nr:sigma 54-interacting transcriptional regulator [Candidatus Syntrophocurvum alkaliphilum]QGT98660.1 Transcriptional regulator [Candidatus Syntrophocurvum alkaliphilum]
MKAYEAVNPNSVFLYSEQTIEEASRLLLDRGITKAPVLDSSNECIGIITKDLLLHAMLNGTSLETRVPEIMQSDCYFLAHDDKLSINNNRQLESGIVLKNGLPVGVIEPKDIINVYIKRRKDEKENIKATMDAVYNPVIAINNNNIIKIFNKWAAKAFNINETKALNSHAENVIPNQEILELLTGEISYPDNKISFNGLSYVPYRKNVYRDSEQIGRVLVLRDISEIETMIQKSEYTKRLNRELEAIIESSFDGLYVTDGQANTLRLNKGFERIMGITQEQCVGRNMKELVDRGVFSRSGTLVALETGDRATLTLTASTGKEALVTSNPIYDEKGNIILVVTNVRDITELNELQRRLERVEGLQELYKTELQQMKLENSRKLIMNSTKMKELINMAMRVADVDSTVLIQGESGVGKELIAETIHFNSNRNDTPFIRLNCGAIPENLLESELFGYEAGAFTGANKNGKVGLFELAQGGILFLDEIGELPLNLQVKLLRVLQDKEIMRVGGVKPIKVNTRIIAGTNRDLMSMVDKNLFRLDLYYRLNVIPITVPPLRERREDIPALMNYFINEFNQKYGMKKRLDNKVYNNLIEYNWPGNVRELENLIERLVVTSIDNTININDLPSSYIKTSSTMLEDDKQIIPLQQAVENTERKLLENAFSRYRTSYQVAQALKVNQSTIVRKVHKYGITR